jgi:hypothetical protein
MAGAAFRPYTKLAELLSYYSASIITSKTCQLKQLHRGYCVALDAVIRITGRGTSREGGRTRALAHAIGGGAADLGGMAGAAGYARSAHRARGWLARGPLHPARGCTPAPATRRFAVLR